MRRQTFPFAIVLTFVLGACMPALDTISSGASQATTIALAGTHAAYTLAALPTMTLPPSNTPLPTYTQTTAPTAKKTSTNPATATTTSDGTQTGTATLTQSGSAVSVTLIVTGTITSTGTTTAAGTSTVTKTPTPGPLLYGTVPPSVPYGRVHLVNLTNEMVYISYHCVLENGLTSYLEYPVYSRLVVSIPAGPCHYVAWVKGNQLIGDIRIQRFLEYTFTFKKQKILISQP
jgi:hypothetical protein